MAIWPFNRKQANNNKVPPEVKQYYESEHRERVGLAWLVAFLSLLLTIAIVAGLFFGGRWIYRKIANNDKPQTTGQSPTEPAPAPSTGNTPQPSTPNDLQPAAPSQNQNNNSSSTGSNSGSSSGSSSSNSNSSSGSSSSSSSSTGGQSATGGKSSQAPNQVANTGPGSNLAIFLGVTALAYLIHLGYQRRKLNNKMSS